MSRCCDPSPCGVSDGLVQLFDGPARYCLFVVSLPAGIFDVLTLADGPGFSHVGWSKGFGLETFWLGRGFCFGVKRLDMVCPDGRLFFGWLRQDPLFFMKERVASLAEDGQVGRSFLADALVGAVMYLEPLMPIADLAAVLSVGESV